MQFKKQNKWKSQQIDKYYKNHASHWKQRSTVYSRQRTNSLKPDNKRHWPWKSGLYNRLKDKSLNNMYCHNITKNQNYVPFAYDNDHDAIKESQSFSLWSCLNCTYNNLGTSINCELCNTPNYSLYVKNTSRNKQQSHEVTLADYLPQNKNTKNDDELLQIAFELSYKNNANISKQTINKYNTNNIKKYSFVGYWKELQNNKIHKRLFKHSCNKYLRETKVIKHKFPMNNEITILSIQTCLKTTFKDQTIFGYPKLMSILPSMAEIQRSFSQLFPDASVHTKCILNPYLLYQFINYGCKRNVSNVQLAYTHMMLKSYNIYENPVVLPNIPDQELLIYGLARTYFSTLSGVPDDIIRMISCFYNIDQTEEWKLNYRNAPTKRIVCYSDFESIDDGYSKQNGKVYVCLVKRKTRNGKIIILRNANILPVYSIHWNGHLGFMKCSYWSHRFYGPKDAKTYHRTSRKCLGEKILKFKPKYEPINSKKSTRKLQRKWSAYHKLSKQ